MKMFCGLGLSLLWMVILGDAYPKICNSGKDCEETECCRAVMGLFLRRCLPLTSEGDWCIPKERKTPFGDIYFGRCPCTSGTICSGETVRNKHGKVYIRNAHCRKAPVSHKEIIPSRNGNFENFFQALHNVIHRPRPVVVIERPSSIASEVGGMPVKDTESSANIDSLDKPKVLDDSKVKLENEAKVSSAVQEKPKKNIAVSSASSEENSNIPSAESGEIFLNSGSDVFNGLKEENKGSFQQEGQSASQSNNVAGEYSKVQSGQGDQSSQVYFDSQQFGQLGQSGQISPNSVQSEQGGQSGQSGPDSKKSGQEVQSSQNGPTSELSGQIGKADQSYLNSEQYGQEGKSGQSNPNSVQSGQGQSIQSYPNSPQTEQITVQKEDQKYSNSLQGSQNYGNEFDQISSQFSNEGQIPNDLLSQEEIVGTDETHPAVQPSKELIHAVQSPNELMAGQIPSDLVHQEEVVRESEKLTDESTAGEKSSIKAIKKEDSFSKNKDEADILDESILQEKVPEKQEPATSHILNEDDESTSEGESSENSEGVSSSESVSEGSEEDSLETSASQETKGDVSDKSSFENSEEDTSKTSEESKEPSFDELSLEGSEKVIFEAPTSKESNEDDSGKPSLEENEAEGGLPDKPAFVENDEKTTDESASSDSAENISDESVSNESEDDNSKTGESEDDSSDTQESEEGSSNIQGSEEDSSDTQESEDSSSDTKENEDDSSDIQESEDDSSDTEENEEDSSDIKENEDDSSDTNESEEDSTDTQKSEEDSTDTQESEEDGAEAQESEEDGAEAQESEEDKSDVQGGEENIIDKSLSQESDKEDGKSEVEQENEEGKNGEEHKTTLSGEIGKDKLNGGNQGSSEEDETSAESLSSSSAFQDINLENSDKADDALDLSKSLQKESSNIFQEREDETSDGLLEPTEAEELENSSESNKKPSGEETINDTSKLEEATNSDRDIETNDAVPDASNDFAPPEAGNYDATIVSMDPESLQKYYVRKYAPTDSA